jgi:glycosidase
MPRALLVAVSALVAALLPLRAAAQPPTISKVEPPSWWIGSTVNPLRILVYGTHLTGAHLEIVDPGLRADNVRVSQGGTYLFADLTIDDSATAGVHTLGVSGPSGSATARFTVLPKLDRAGRFQGLSSDDVIYLAMPDRFADGDPSNNDPTISPGLFDRTKPRYYHGGDFKGITSKLPYLKDLGVTAIWLNPWYDNVNHLNRKETYDNQPITDYHGYGAVDFYGVEEHFGSFADLQALVARAHALGLKVIQDQVANHTGPYHPWVDDSPTPTWFNGTAADHVANTWQVWTLQDPHATSQDQRATLDGWFIDILPDLNQQDEDVARYIIQNAVWWTGTLGLDAIRQDTWPYVPRAFWARWMEALEREFPGLTAVGELFDEDPALVSFFIGGAARFDGIDTHVDSLFDFPLMGAIRRTFAKGETIRRVAQVLAHDHLYPDASKLTTFLGNHDMARFMNEPGATAAGLELAQTFLLTTRGVPQLYYGDEIGLPGGSDPDNRRDMPGGFPGDPRDAFTPAGRTSQEDHIFRHLQAVLHLRQELEPLRRGALQQLYVADRQYSYARTTAAASVVIAINNDASSATWSTILAGTHVPDNAVLVDRLGVIGPATVKDGAVSLTLPPRSAAILTVQ